MGSRKSTTHINIMKIRDFINNIKFALNANHLDTSISDEVIYNEAISIASLLLKREADSRKVFKNTSFYNTLPSCIEMIEVPVSECSVRIPCNKIRRSKKKLPKLFTGNHGTFINIYNILRTGRYIETTINQYINRSNLRYKVPNIYYFWIENDYLYIPDSDIEAVYVSGLFIDLESFIEYDNKNCIKILDLSLPFPDYIVSLVSEQVLNKLSSNLKIVPDEKPNLNSNEKN